MRNLHSSVDLGQVSVGNKLWRLEADTNLESSWAPVDELDSLLCLETGNGCVNLLGNNVSTVQKTCCHVLSIARIALNHLVVWLKAGVGDLLYGVGLMGSLCGGDDRRVGNQREMNSWVWHQVGLELVQVNVQRTVETQRCSDGGHNCIMSVNALAYIDRGSCLPWAINLFKFS